MTADAECRYYGRDFTTQEMVVLRTLIAASPPPNRHALSREFCGSIRNFVLWAIVMKKKGASYGNREGTIGPAVGGA